MTPPACTTSACAPAPCAPAPCGAPTTCTRNVRVVGATYGVDCEGRPVLFVSYILEGGSADRVGDVVPATVDIGIAAQDGGVPCDWAQHVNDIDAPLAVTELARTVATTPEDEPLPSTPCDAAAKANALAYAATVQQKYDAARAAVSAAVQEYARVQTQGHFGFNFSTDIVKLHAVNNLLECAGAALKRVCEAIDVPAPCGLDVRAAGACVAATVRARLAALEYWRCAVHAMVVEVFARLNDVVVAYVRQMYKIAGVYNNIVTSVDIDTYVVTSAPVIATETTLTDLMHPINTFVAKITQLSVATKMLDAAQAALARIKTVLTVNSADCMKILFKLLKRVVTGCGSGAKTLEAIIAEICTLASDALAAYTTVHNVQKAQNVESEKFVAGVAARLLIELGVEDIVTGRLRLCGALPQVRCYRRVAVEALKAGFTADGDETFAASLARITDLYATYTASVDTYLDLLLAFATAGKAGLDTLCEPMKTTVRVEAMRVGLAIGGVQTVLEKDGMFALLYAAVVHWAPLATPTVNVTCWPVVQEAVLKWYNVNADGKFAESVEALDAIVEAVADALDANDCAKPPNRALAILVTDVKTNELEQAYGEALSLLSCVMTRRTLLKNAVDAQAAALRTKLSICPVVEIVTTAIIQGCVNTLAQAYERLGEAALEADAVSLLNLVTAHNHLVALNGIAHSMNDALVAYRTPTSSDDYTTAELVALHDSASSTHTALTLVGTSGMNAADAAAYALIKLKACELRTRIIDAYAEATQAVQSSNACNTCVV